MLKPSIEWTDTIGAATLTCIGLTFMNWTPDANFIGESVVPVGDNVTYTFAYRDDDMVAAFEVAQIANTELKLALRLKQHLVRGGTCTINTRDSENRVYTSRVAPATVPELTMTDTIELEYTLKVQVVNNVNAHMLYTPVAHGRPTLITLSPSPLSMPFPGSTATVTATCADALGNPIAGVVLSASSGSPGAFTVNPTAVTDADGEATFTLTPHAGGSGNLTVSTPGASATDTITVTTGVYGIDPAAHAAIIWLDRDSITGIGDGLDIPTWADSSPNGWDMTTTEVGYANPHWDAATLGGSVNFVHGSSMQMSNEAFDSFNGRSAFTLFLVGIQAGYGFMTLRATVPGAGDGVLYGYQSGGYMKFDASDFTWEDKYPFSGTDPHIFELVYDGTQSTNATKCKQRLDGTDEAHNFYSTLPAVFAPGNGLVIGQGVGIGTLQGHIAELLIFAGALSDADAASVRTQLASKYGL